MITLICDLENALYVREDQIEKLTEQLTQFVQEKDQERKSQTTQQEKEITQLTSELLEQNELVNNLQAEMKQISLLKDENDDFQKQNKELMEIIKKQDTSNLDLQGVHKKNLQLQEVISSQLKVIKDEKELNVAS